MASLHEIQMLVEQIKNDLPALIQRSQVTPQQIVIAEGLSDMSERLGLIQAGEFRTGNGLEPGYGFTGVRMGYPAFSYSGNTWHIAGVNDDVLQFGLRATDGVAVAAGGSIVLDGDALKIINLTDADDPFLIFYSSNGTALGQILTNSAGNLELGAYGTAGAERKLVLRSQIGDGSVNVSTVEVIANYNNTGVDWITLSADITSLVTSMTDGITPDIRWRENPALDNQSLLEMFPGSAGGRTAFGYDHFIDFLEPDGTGTARVYFNERNKDIDFSIETLNQSAAFYMDAGLDKATSFAWDGWNKRDETWTRTGNHTYTVSGDVTATYRKGVKVKYKDGGSFEYGVIKTSSHSAGTTTVTLIANTNYAMAAATITDRYISLIEKPEGFPEQFDFSTSVSYAAGTTDPTSVTVTIAKWRVVNSDFIVTINASLVRGAGDRHYTIFSLPVEPIGVAPVGGMDDFVAGLTHADACYGQNPSGTGNVYYLHIAMSAATGNYYINGAIPF